MSDTKKPSLSFADVMLFSIALSLIFIHHNAARIKESVEKVAQCQQQVKP